MLDNELEFAKLLYPFYRAMVQEATFFKTNLYRSPNRKANMHMQFTEAMKDKFINNPDNPVEFRQYFRDIHPAIRTIVLNFIDNLPPAPTAPTASPEHIQQYEHEVTMRCLRIAFDTTKEILAQNQKPPHLKYGFKGKL